jgi:NAD(P)-dependent dehydrogenase (short-subunit alcohol dehydrogenase family)
VNPEPRRALRRTGGDAVSFAGQVVFITGGGSGMERLAAQRMADAGAKVAQILRRLVPGLVWSAVHRIEGR